MPKKGKKKKGEQEKGSVEKEGKEEAYKCPDHTTKELALRKE